MPDLVFAEEKDGGCWQGCTLGRLSLAEIRKTWCLSAENNGGGRQ